MQVAGKRAIPTLLDSYDIIFLGCRERWQNLCSLAAQYLYLLGSYAQFLCKLQQSPWRRPFCSLAQLQHRRLCIEQIQVRAACNPQRRHARGRARPLRSMLVFDIDRGGEACSRMPWLSLSQQQRCRNAAAELPVNANLLRGTPQVRALDDERGALGSRMMRDQLMRRPVEGRVDRDHHVECRDRGPQGLDILPRLLERMRRGLLGTRRIGKRGIAEQYVERQTQIARQH